MLRVPLTDEACGVTVLEGPSTEAWTSVKGIFIELYVHRGKKLPEVQRILADHCDFHATQVLLILNVTAAAS